MPTRNQPTDTTPSGIDLPPEIERMITDHLGPAREAEIDARVDATMVEAIRFVATARALHRACRARPCRKAGRCTGQPGGFACGIETAGDGAAGEIARLVAFATQDRLRRALRRIEAADAPF